MTKLALTVLLFPSFLLGVDFIKDVQPILAQRCISCHGEKSHMGNLRLDSRQAADHVLSSGLLIRKVSGQEKTTMPPVGAPLTAEQITTLKTWIDAGAVWPASASFSKHWAFEPVRRPALPASAGRTEIDRFILARLAKENIAPSPEADKRTLLRRVSLDLTGLPQRPRRLRRFSRMPRPVPMSAPWIDCLHRHTLARSGLATGWI